MLVENLGAKGNRFLRGNGSVRQDFQSKLVVIRNVTDTGGPEKMTAVIEVLHSM